MRNRQRIIVLSVIACSVFAALPSYAQSDRNSTLYINLQLANQRYAFHYPSAGNTLLTLNPVHLSVGYSFTSKFALQVGGVLGRSKHELISSGTTTAGLPTRSLTEDKISMIALPVLGRYTLGRQDDKHFNIDLLLGPVLVYSKAEAIKTETSNGVAAVKYETLNRGWNTLITGGIGVRYSLSKYLQIIGDIALNKNPEINQKLDITGNSLGLTSSFGLGIQYRFTTK